MDLNITPHVLFSDKMWYFKMPDHESWKNKLEAIAQIESNKEISKISTQPDIECNVKALRTAWESHNIYPAIGDICKIIASTFLPKIAESEKYNVKDGRGNEMNLFTENSWLNVYKKNQHAVPHQHVGNIFSCVYFVKIPDKSCDFYFHNPRKGMLNSTGEGQMSDLKVDVEEGQVITFNGDLLHSVTPNLSDETRLTLAINYRPHYYVY